MNRKPVRTENYVTVVFPDDLLTRAKAIGAGRGRRSGRIDSRCGARMRGARRDR